ncbi:hypothetical protein B7463_g4717, partial [Scytalidium lignicola]
MIVDYNAGDLRTYLRIYFLVVLTVLGLVGNACCASAAKVKLYGNKPVWIHLMTGWQKGTDVFTTMFSLRRLPGGWWLGCIMIVAAFLTLGADLAVTRTVVAVTVESRCLFLEGLILDTSGGGNIWQTLPWNGQPKIVASNAQITSQENGCLAGVFAKINRDPSFCAGPQDILGSWICVEAQQNVTYSSDTSTSAIVADLTQKGYLYVGASDEVTNYDDGSTNHLVTWATSAGDTTGIPSTLRYFCSVDTLALDTILSNIATQATFLEWIPLLQGGVYDGSNTPAASYAKLFIEELLNTMTMVQGGSNYLLSIPIAGQDTTQGCITSATNLPVAILVRGGLAIVLLIVVTLQWLVLLLRLRLRLGLTEDTMSTFTKVVPDGLTGWQLHAARETVFGQEGQGAEQALPMKVWELNNTWQFQIVHKDNQQVAKLVRVSNQDTNELHDVYENAALTSIGRD